MTDIILHHYSGSPYAEKIRCLLGYKNLPWRSHEISTIHPRPSLKRIFGDFRRTPILQLGSDFICDTRLIAQVLNEIKPEKPLSTNSNRVLSELISGWVEPRAFVLTGPLRFRSPEDIEGVFNGDVNAQEFGADRTPFMIPAIEVPRFSYLRNSAEDHISHYLRLIEELLADGRAYIGGDQPCFADFSVYHLIWWLRVPPVQGEILSDFPLINAWADSISKFGHGNYSHVKDEDVFTAIDDAQGSSVWKSPWPEQQDDRLGKNVSIRPDDYGKNSVKGRVVASTDRHITIQFSVESIGLVNAHFPKLGYEITLEE